jgi:hypothetical protein
MLRSYDKILYVDENILRSHDNVRLGHDNSLFITGTAAPLAE